MYYFVCYDTKIQCTDKNRIYRALKGKHEAKHPFPLNLLLPKLDFSTEVSCFRSFWDMRNGVLQYIPIKIAIVTIDLLDLHFYNRISFSAEIYYMATIIASVSVSVAMYYLVVFFHTLDAELVQLFYFIIIETIQTLVQVSDHQGHSLPHLLAGNTPLLLSVQSQAKQVLA